MYSKLARWAPAPIGAAATLLFAPWWISLALVGAAVPAMALKWRRHHDGAGDRSRSGPPETATIGNAAEEYHADGVLLFSGTGRLEHLSRSVGALLGWDDSELRRMTVGELVHPDDADAVRQAYRDVVATSGATATVDARIRTVDAWKPVEMAVTNRLDTAGVILVQLRDITREHALQLRLVRRQAQLQATADIAAQALHGRDEATLIRAVVTVAREALAADGCEIYRTTGTAPELIEGVGPGGIHLDRRSTTMTGAALASAAADRRAPAWEVDGQVVTSPAPAGAVTAVATPIGAADGTDGALIARGMSPMRFDAADVAFLDGLAGLVALARRRRGAEQAAFRRARHDELTGLVNREVLLERLQTSIDRPGRAGESVAVLLIDLDHFKIVNDSLGHAAGDALIEAVAARLQLALRPGDTLARFGGDEFVVLARRLASGDHATMAAERMLSVLDAPFPVADHEVLVTASVGVAVAAEETSAGVVMQQADAALFRAKELGRDRVAVFEPTLHDAAVTRLRVEEELREALAGDQLRVFYQPIVDLATGRSDRVEGLVRWVHPQQGLVSPAEFLPISEATGLIEEIGAWVIDEVARQARVWKDRGTPRRVSVNASPRQLTDPSLAQTFADAIERHEIEPGMLAIEVTEHALSAQPELAVRTLEALAAQGVGIVIDDFGTGYASLTQLRALPIDLVKIDRSFVAGIGRSGDEYTIVAAIIQLARVVGDHVVAEGVETEQQLELLRELGCDLAQGFLFSPAVFDPEIGPERHERVPPRFDHQH